ncbi:MAG: 50S ribosomal protein L7/L12, partial [Candidatus Cloacimonadales bacterium]|nr:50S ribosomal protein L7/L12 [Candidatus Cloacimonadales bacterium]
MSEKKQQIIDILKEMTVIELSELVKELEEIFGVTAAAPVAVAAAGAAPAAAAEEKTEFNV